MMPFDYEVMCLVWDCIPDSFIFCWDCILRIEECFEGIALSPCYNSYCQDWYTVVIFWLSFHDVGWLLLLYLILMSSSLEYPCLGTLLGIAFNGDYYLLWQWYSLFTIVIVIWFFPFSEGLQVITTIIRNYGSTSSYNAHPFYDYHKYFDCPLLHLQQDILMTSVYNHTW